MTRTEHDTVWSADRTAHRMFHVVYQPLNDETYGCTCGWIHRGDWFEGSIAATAHLKASNTYQIPTT